MRILLVDDDENLLFMASRFMSRVEPTYEVITTASPNIAIKKLAEEHFDIIIADYKMPELNGLQLLETLRNEGNNIPFIMFTGRGDKDVANRALDLGADYYLWKNSTLRSLYNELAYLIRNVMLHRQMNEAHNMNEDNPCVERI